MGVDTFFKFRHNLDTSSRETLIADLQRKTGIPVFDDTNRRNNRKRRHFNHISIRFWEKDEKQEEEASVAYEGPDFTDNFDFAQIWYIYPNHLYGSPEFNGRYMMLHYLVANNSIHDDQYEAAINDFIAKRKILHKTLLPLMKECMVFYIPDIFFDISELWELDVDDIAWCKEREFQLFNVSDFLLGTPQPYDPDKETLFIDDFADLIHHESNDK